jgi:hypothetical protein
MPTALPSMRTFGTLVVVLGVAAACSGGGGGPSIPTVSTPTILTTSPPDGAVDVEPTAPVLLDIALPEGGTPVGDVTVCDGGNELDGELVALGGIRWRWQPLGQLPRGNRIEIRSRSQGAVASFSVREADAQRSYELPGMTASALRVWPNGRAALRADGRWFEVTDGGLVERFVQMPDTIFAYGDGEALWYEQDPSSQQWWSVRGGLDGERDRTLPPSVTGPVAVNGRGDFVMFVSGSHPEPSERGLWRLDHDAVAWELAGPTDVEPQLAVFRLPHIADDGAVSIVADLPQPELRRFARGSLDAEITALPEGFLYTYVAQDKHGAGWAFWFEVESPGPLLGGSGTLYGARYQPGVGLGAIVELHRWADRLALPLLSFEPDRLAALAGRGGSVLLRLQTQGVGVYSTRQEALRVEPDGWTSEPWAYATGSGTNEIILAPGRAEFWVRPYLLLSPYATVAIGWRSRPGAESEQIADPGIPLAPIDPLWELTEGPLADESGRMFSVYQTVQPGNAATAAQVVVIE